MRRLVAAVSVAFMLGMSAPVAQAAVADPGVACPSPQPLPLLAAAGTGVGPSFWLPGTAVYDGQNFQGAPYVVPQGCDLRIVNTDVSLVENGHQVVSFARKQGKPLFKSAVSEGPDASVIVPTAKLPPGVYPYFCLIHFGMFGQIEIR